MCREAEQLVNDDLKQQTMQIVVYKNNECKSKHKSIVFI